MDTEQTFLRVHARISSQVVRLLNPRFRRALEKLCLFNAAMLLALLVVMHNNFVDQPGCSAKFAEVDASEAQLIQIKITGSWNTMADSTMRAWAQGKVTVLYINDELRPSDEPEDGQDRVDKLDKRSKLNDPMYLYSIEKGFLILSETAKSKHDIRTVNISISAHDECFGNRFLQLLIDNIIGYDTILMNSLLFHRRQGYLYNFQTKELFNFNYIHEPGSGLLGFEDYVVSKCGVLVMSLFVFFTTTMSVSFTLRETQSRMLRFTAQLQLHAQHRLPTFRLIFFHVFESLVFVPIMIGILFFLSEVFGDLLLAFVVLILVWLCELFHMISVWTPISRRYFPRFFFLYFLAFHIYFFSYTHGFSYLAFCATAAFLNHLVLYFWNTFEVPALQSRRAL